MGKLFYLMGKSAAGKDTLYEALCRDASLALRRGVLYTTRPMRAGEIDGQSYYFVDEACLNRLSREGKVLESRTYQTAAGLWTYFTVDDGQLSAHGPDMIMVGTLESFQKIREVYGPRVIPLYIEVDDGIRLLRAIKREQAQLNPNYSELCRRYLADEQDFSQEKLAAAGIAERFYNNDFETCLLELKKKIRGSRKEEGDGCIR